MKNISFPRWLKVAASLCSLLLLTGCYETKQEFTINPDGSGKVVHECSFQELDFTGKTEPTERLLEGAVARIINESKGVEAWRDVSFNIRDDGWLYFKGTAYFKDLRALEIKDQMWLKFDWRAANGEGVLTLRTNRAKLRSKQKSVDWGKLTAEEHSKELKAERARFQRNKPIFGAVLGTIKHEAIFRLPGKINSSTNFPRKSDGTLRLQFDGNKALTALEKLINDDVWVAKNLNLLNDPDDPAMDAEARELFFGGREPVQATAVGGAALFDYATELVAATKETAALVQKLSRAGQKIALKPPPSQGGNLKGIKVVGARLVTDPPYDKFRPFDEEPGYTLALQADFPGSILNLTDNSRLETAIADDGSSLLTDSRRAPQMKFPRLSEDGTSALIEANLHYPGPAVKGLRELSGRLEYECAGPIKEIDLGFPELRLGSKGTQLEAQIEALKPGWRNVGAELRLKLNVGRQGVRAVYLVVDGVKSQLEPNGVFSLVGDWRTITYESKTAIPAKGKLVAEMVGQPTTFITPFKLENISLLGAPLSAK